MNVHLIISGRVQGVGFRYSAQQKAAEYRLAGWVRNNPDETVELEAEGSEASINAYVNDLQAGFNPAIHVEHIEQEHGEEKGYKKFSIK